MTPATPRSVQRSLQEAYLRYYDTAFRLRDERLQDERRALLERPGVVFTDPLIEPIPTYDPATSISDCCDEVGASTEVADALGRMLFGADGSFPSPGAPGYGLKSSLGSDPGAHNVVVTSGHRLREDGGFPAPDLRPPA